MDGSALSSGYLVLLEEKYKKNLKLTKLAKTYLNKIANEGFDDIPAEVDLVVIPEATEKEENDEEENDEESGEDFEETLFEENQNQETLEHTSTPENQETTISTI